MLMKKSYLKNPDGTLKYKKGDFGALIPIVASVKIKRISADGKQRFSTKIAKMGVEQGWLELTKEHIIIDGAKFKIIAFPGRVCGVCGEKLPDDQTGDAAREHIKSKHSGEGSYDCPNFYETQLEA